MSKGGIILWWGRFDPAYSRNRILRDILKKCGFTLRDFVPRSSFLGGIEAYFTRPEKPDAVWVPAFRHRDCSAARRFADRHDIPLIFDPMISAWDKAVFERKKFSTNSRKADKLLHWERKLFSGADLVIADTEPHARFFRDQLSSPGNRTKVIPVGAEESLFLPQRARETGSPPEILFYGSFINLQGPETIIEAAIAMPHLHWTLLGQGPLRDRCEKLAGGHSHIRFEEWLPYQELPKRIGSADLLLGIFGTSPKAGRVIPNKVHQSLACSRPLVTRESEAYPPDMGRDGEHGIFLTPPGDSEALRNTIDNLLSSPTRLPEWGRNARRAYETWFSEEIIKADLLEALALIGL